jgi:hypothetical protein
VGELDEEDDMKDEPKQDNARRESAERAFKRREDGAQAMSEYEAEGHAVRAKTSRLKALRLAKAANEKAAVVAKKRKTVIIPPQNAKRVGQPSSEKATATAAEMAGKEIYRLGDRSATDGQRASRTRRLLKGPKEFRDIRDDGDRASRRCEGSRRRP